MEQLANGYTLDIPPGAFPLSTDSMVLSDFVRLPRSARVLDLGSGCGTLGLLLCASDPQCRVTGIELDPVAHEAALENIRRNDLSARLSSVCADIASIPPSLAPGSFTTCVSNPPYFTGGPDSRRFAAARKEGCCTVGALFEAAARALCWGGNFYLVHRPERLAELTAAASAVRLEPKRLALVRHREGGPVSLILLSCRKGAKPGLRWEEYMLFHADGTPTEDYRRIYRL